LGRGQGDASRALLARLDVVRSPFHTLSLNKPTLAGARSDDLFEEYASNVPGCVCPHPGRELPAIAAVGRDARVVVALRWALTLTAWGSRWVWSDD
jgi:hypothetical protein